MDGVLPIALCGVALTSSAPYCYPARAHDIQARQKHRDNRRHRRQALLMALSFCWGLSWTAMRIALDEVSPWGMRLIGYSIGAATLWF